MHANGTFAKKNKKIYGSSFIVLLLFFNSLYSAVLLPLLPFAFLFHVL